jgi:hypothetical protein
MVDSLMRSLVVGVVFACGEWLVRRRRIRMMQRVEDPSALVPWLDAEFRSLRTVTWSLVGFCGSWLVLLFIKWL